MRALITAFVLLLTNCSTMVETGNVPGFHNVSYYGPHDKLVVANLLVAFDIEWRREFFFAPPLEDLVIYEEPEAIGLSRHPEYPNEKATGQRGRTFNQNEVSVKIEASLSRGALAHELVHVVLWRTKRNPDSDIPLDAQGYCLADENGICSHAGGSGPWTTAHDRVVDRTNRRSRGGL